MKSASTSQAPSSLADQLRLREGDALIVVDVQRDFFQEGSLAVPNANEIIAPLNAYIGAFEQRRLPIFFSRDWHPVHHCSFIEAAGPWPRHCVQDTTGAMWVPGINVPATARVVSKATSSEADAYSAFDGTDLSGPSAAAANELSRSA